ncbi:UrcA family protein [Altererythrobacter fulvus]|uniref:UrcA family protein n=1 Tax=Caenibius fulvus TaxID=2126012 RepID=UPI0030174458
MRKFILPLLAVATLAGAATPALAGEVTIRVRMDGIDFTDPASLDTAKDRIDSAVSRACKMPAMFRFYGKQAVEDCVADGKAKALNELEARLPAAE